jgi:hypothetical protein
MIDLTPPFPPPQPPGTLLQLSVDPLPPIAPGQSFDITIHLVIAERYHVQPYTASDPLAVKTVARLRAVADSPAISQQWNYPEPQLIHDSAAYAGTATLTARCSVPHDTPLGPLPCRAIVHAQPCSAGACLPPEQVTADFSLLIQARASG